MSRLTSFLEPLRARATVTLQGSIFIVLVSAFLAFNSFVGLPGVEWFEPIAAGLAGGIVSQVVLLLLVDLQRRICGRSECSLPRIFAMYAVAGGVRSAVLLALMAQDIGGMPNEVGFRFFAGVAQIALWLAIANAIVDRISEQQRQRSRALAIARRRESLRLEAAGALATESAEFEGIVRERILPAIQLIEDRLLAVGGSGSAADATALAAEVREFCEVEVRQVSHRLAESRPLRPANFEPGNEVPWFLTAQKVFHRAELYPVFSLVTAMLMSVPLLWLKGGAVGLFWLLPGEVGVYSLPLLLDQFGSGWRRREGWPRLLHQWIELGFMILVAEATVFWSPLPTVAPLLADQLKWMVPIGMVLIWVIANLSLGSIAGLERVNSEVRALNQELNNETEELTQRQRSLQRSRAQLLHGPVQGRLAAVAMALNLHINDPGDGWVDSAREQLESAKQELNDAIRSNKSMISLEPLDSVAERLRRHADQWRGLMDVEIEVDPQVDSLLEHRHDIQSALVDSVAECFVNSVRHGRARNATVNVQVRASEAGMRLSCVVRDDGSGGGSRDQSGLGGRLLLGSEGSRRIQATADGAEVNLNWNL